MFKLSTKIALAALLSISALSTVDASRGNKWGEERFQSTGHKHNLRYDRSYDHRQHASRGSAYGQEVAQDDVDHFDYAPVRRDGQYNLGQHDIYGQPANNGFRGQYIEHDDEEYVSESFADKAKRFVSNHKKEILIGTAILTAVIGTVTYFMSGGQEEEEQYQPYHPGVVHDPILNFAADVAAKEAERVARLGLNLIASDDTAVAVWAPAPSFIGSVVNTASHWLSGMTRQFYGS